MGKRSASGHDYTLINSRVFLPVGSLTTAAQATTSARRREEPKGTAIGGGGGGGRPVGGGTGRAGEKENENTHGARTHLRVVYMVIKYCSVSGVLRKPHNIPARPCAHPEFPVSFVVEMISGGGGSQPVRNVSKRSPRPYRGETVTTSGQKRNRYRCSELRGPFLSYFNCGKPEAVLTTAMMSTQCCSMLLIKLKIV